MNVKSLKMEKVLLMAVLLILLLLPSVVWAEGDEIAQGGKATTMEELNQALGGGHTIAGNQLTLERDITVENTITIQLTEPLVLDLNKNKIVYDKKVEDPNYVPDSRLFWLKSPMTLDGDGAIDVIKDDAAFLVYEGDLTINSGTIKLFQKYGCAAIEVESVEKVSKVIINGGSVTAGPRAMRFRAYTVADLEVNGGVVAGNIEILNPGNSVVFKDKPNTVKIKGGTMKIIHCTNTDFTMEGGSASSIVAQDDSNVSFHGGNITRGGIDIDNSKYIMTGGTVKPTNSNFGVHLYNNSQGEISGGTIITSEKTAKGVSCERKASLRFSGGVIRSTAKGNIGQGICAYGWRNDPVKVILQGGKGERAYIKGYKYGIYQRGESTVVPAKNTKVFTPKGSKSSYKSGQKLPKSVKGDIAIR